MLGDTRPGKTYTYQLALLALVRHAPRLSDDSFVFVAISQFAVANGMGDEVREAFRHRPHLVDNAPGFMRLEVLNPRDEPESFWLITYWDSETSFRDWHRSHLYHESHHGIPPGLKLVVGRNLVQLFDHIAS